MTTTPLMPFDQAVKEFDPVIGIEIHVELDTKSKMFDPAPNISNQDYTAEPNTAISAITLALPGTLPVLNEKAVEYAIRLGLALNCSIAEVTTFDRKNYFYPDIPKNFQTSQGAGPICYDGHLDIELDDGEVFRVEIERAHMEEDAGKNVHIGGADGRIFGATHSLLDFNRAGVPLVEIVTKPILGTGDRAPEVAAKYVETVRDIARAIGVSQARMERGNVRADVNLSLRANPKSPLGTRTETKNVNSLRSIDKAVRFEVGRQAAVLSSGGTVTQETRHFHEEDGTTSSGRPKSDADDYRYFPEPDLVPVAPSREWVEEIRATLPELPVARRRRLKEAWGYSDAEMRDVVNAGAVDVIEATIAAGAPAAAARKWWMGELSRRARAADKALTDLTISAAQIAALQGLVDAGTINDKLARQVLDGVLAGDGEPAEIVDRLGLAIVSDDGPLLAAIDAALEADPTVVAKIREGNLGPVGAIIGAVMKATKGQADAKRVRELTLERING
ncbi:MAG: Asp-tRNA(Asn)/Glu-tRNA(Gln) amidotransferase subunit GatB [Promicromonosporaceae bacterium]|nr:Asp-tRNA(Asn)/Glu-tRNA(Gln) amidotransferase subunit GatB [Promicromonosporaceae bacterium]